MPLPTARLFASCESDSEKVHGLGDLADAKGKCLYRDFRRHARRLHDMPEMFWTEIPLFNANGQVEEVSHPVLLPHETFSYLADGYPQRFLERVCGGSWRAVKRYWKDHSRDDWCEAHREAQTLRESGVDVAPCTLYGDDAEMHRGSAATIVTWSSPLCCLPTWESRMLVTVLPLRHVTPDTMEALYKVIRWSFDVLLSRRHPTHGPDGKPMEGARGRRAGTPLSPDGSTMVVIQILGDWKFIKECLLLKRFWGAHRICHCCAAVAAGVGPLYTDLTEDAIWRHTFFDNYAFIQACYSVYLPQLCRLPGFHVGMVVPDIMHAVHLGVLGLVVSSLMLAFAKSGAFGHATGTFRDRLAAQLRQVAYPMFVDWCNARPEVQHSQPRFRPGLIGCSKPNLYPEWHGKAHNCYIVAQWLGCVVHLLDGPLDLERVVMRGMNTVLAFLHRLPRTTLTPDEREECYSAGHLALQAYDLLSRRAIANDETLWPLKPKLHVFQHHLINIRKSGVLPPWSFPDEDFNGRLTRLEQNRKHFASLGERIMSRWALAYASEI